MSLIPSSIKGVDAVIKRNEFVNMKNVYQDIFDSISTSTDEETIVDKLQMGINLLNNKSKDAFPVDFFGEESVRLIFDFAFKAHNTPVSVTALSFIERVFIANKDFNLNVIRGLTDTDLVQVLFDYLQDPEAIDIEFDITLRMIGQLLRKDLDSRNHVHNIFTLEYMKSLLESNPKSVEFFADYCDGITSFPIEVLEDTLAIANEAVQIIASCTVEDPKIAGNLFGCLLNCFNMYKEVIEVLPPPDIFDQIVDFYFDRGNRINYCLLNIFQLLPNPTKSRLYNIKFLDHYVICHISSGKIPKGTYKRKTLLCAINLLTKVVSDENNPSDIAPFIFRDKMRDYFGRLLGEGNVETRLAVARLCVACLENPMVSRSVGHIMVHKRYGEKMADFLDQDCESEILLVLRFFYCLTEFARKNADLSSLYYQLEEYHDTIEEHSMSENPKIAQIAHEIMMNLYHEQYNDDENEEEDED